MSSAAPGHRSVNASRRTDGDKRPKGSSKNDSSGRNASHQQSVNHNSKSTKLDSNQVNNNSTSKPSDSGHESKSKRMQMTQEQLRIASLMNEKTDLTELETKVKTLMSLTRIDRDSAIVALHDCDGDLEAAADKILVDDFKNDFIESKPRKSKIEKGTAQISGNDRDRSSAGSRQVQVRGGRGRGSLKPRNDRESRPENGERKERRPPREDRAEGGDRESSDRGFRGRGGRGNLNRGRGSRTFVNNTRPPQPREVEVVEKPVAGSPRGNDTLGDKIGTWEPTDGSKPTAPISHLTVGNWSDVVREDLSEDEATSGKISTAVFVPSGKTLREDPEPAPGFEQQINRPPLPHPSMPHQPMPHQPMSHQPMSHQSMQDQSRTAGAQLLQSLKQSPNQVQGSSALYNQSASESLKSLVGISAASQSYGGPSVDQKSPSVNSMNPQGTMNPQTSMNPQGSMNPQSSMNQQSVKKMTRIPSSAVEMPSNDPVTALGVQFGALDVNFDGNVQANRGGGGGGGGYEQQVRSDKPAPGPHSGILGSTQTVDDRAKSYGNKSAIDSGKSSDLYQNSGQQSGQQVGDGFKSTPAPGYGPTPPYSAGFNSSSSYNTYSNHPVSYSQTSNYSNQGSNKNQSLSALRDFQDTNAGQKYPDLHNSGFVTSTQTTNVIKNSLPATGKGQVPNVAAQLPAQMMHPSYINVVSSPVGLTPFYPVYPDPSQMQVTGGGGRGDLSGGGFTNYPSGTNLTGVGSDSSKYPRSSQDDSHGSLPSVSSSQSVNVSQAGQHSVGQPPFINMPSFPPGYGYYFAAMPQQGLFPTHGTPFVPVTPATNSAPGGNLFGKGNSAYPSYAPSTNTYDVNSSDAYKQSSSYGQRNVLSSDLMSGVSGSGSGSGSGGFGGKQTNQGPKSSYEKMNQYQASSAGHSSAGSSYNMAAGGMSGSAGTTSAYQGAPYSMVGHHQQQQLPQSFQEAANVQNRSNQRNTGSAGNKAGYGNYWLNG